MSHDVFSCPCAQRASIVSSAPAVQDQTGADHCTGCRLGLIAVAQGSGEVSLFDIPDPAEALLHRDELRKGKGRADSLSGADRLVGLLPCASAGADAISGSLVGCLEWLPSAPHDLLLVRSIPLGKVKGTSEQEV